uniref:CWF21 domain-containing protein n=1 Tax=Oryza brachyantha TaxID=4533 RepID=J3LW10_ORYBR
MAEHERRRAMEVRLLELQDALEEQGYTDAEIAPASSRLARLPLPTPTPPPRLAVNYSFRKVIQILILLSNMYLKNESKRYLMKVIRGKKVIIGKRYNVKDSMEVTEGNPIDKEAYHRLVGCLVYLCHTRPDISYAVSVVSRYMYDPRTSHLDFAHRILRYVKGTAAHDFQDQGTPWHSEGVWPIFTNKEEPREKSTMSHSRTRHVDHVDILIASNHHHAAKVGVAIGHPIGGEVGVDEDEWGGAPDVTLAGGERGYAHSVLDGEEGDHPTEERVEEGAESVDIVVRAKRGEAVLGGH